jgi:hypothetical protein
VTDLVFSQSWKNSVVKKISQLSPDRRRQIGARNHEYVCGLYSELFYTLLPCRGLI